MTSIGRIIIYTGKMQETMAFYARHFGFTVHEKDGDRIVELRPPAGGLVLLLHPAGRAQRQGQSLLKLVFDVEDVADFCARAREGGLDFGPLHQAEGYCFANARDPSGNPISVSSRVFADL